MQTYTAADALRAMEASFALGISRGALQPPVEDHDLGAAPSDRPRPSLAAGVAARFRRPRRLDRATQSGAATS